MKIFVLTPFKGISPNSIGAQGGHKGGGRVHPGYFPRIFCNGISQTIEVREVYVTHMEINIKKLTQMIETG